MKASRTLLAARSRIIVALDLPTAPRALALARQLAGRPGFFKVGIRLFTAAGPDLVRALVARGERVFLDLKFHDIPSIVSEACIEAADLGASLLTVHAAGGAAQLQAARHALEKHCGRRRPRLLGVTLLTSLRAGDLHRIGFRGGLEPNLVRLAQLAQANGCDGVVAAPTDIAAIRRACGKNFLIVTPGIRASIGSKAADQARVAIAAAAIRAGADYVVVGRAIYARRSPLHAFDSLATEIQTALV